MSKLELLSEDSDKNIKCLGQQSGLREEQKALSTKIMNGLIARRKN